MVGLIFSLFTEMLQPPVLTSNQAWVLFGILPLCQRLLEMQIVSLPLLLCLPVVQALRCPNDNGVSLQKFYRENLVHLVQNHHVLGRRITVTEDCPLTYSHLVLL